MILHVQLNNLFLLTTPIFKLLLPYLILMPIPNLTSNFIPFIFFASTLPRLNTIALLIAAALVSWVHRVV